MAIKTLLPTTNINYDDIRDTLNANGGSVSNVFETVFKEAALINKWSKHKPVERNDFFCQDFDESRTDYVQNWWKGNDGMCGLSFGVKDGTTIRNLTDINDIQNADWYYVPVATSYPLRLTDFAQYKPDAESIINTRLGDIVEGNRLLGDLTINIDTIIGSDNLQLTVDDMADILGGYYYAAAIKGAGTNNLWREFRGTRILNSNGSISIGINNLSNGNYQLALFASDSATPGEGDMIPLPVNTDGKTWTTLKVIATNSFEFELTHVADALSATTWTAIDDITSYRVRSSGVLYFKGVVRKIADFIQNVPDTELQGKSDKFEGGTTKQGLHNKIYNASKQVMNTISTPSGSVGAEYAVYVEWDGYVGDSEPEEPEPINGALDILYQINANDSIAIGGSDGFDLTFG